MAGIIEQVKSKWKWRGCCLLLFIFAAVFTLTVFGLSIWGQYKKITTGGIVATDLNNIKTIDREQVETKDDPWYGNPVAPVVIVEFGDFSCPFCKQMFSILHELILQYPKEIKIIYRDFLGHNESQKSAEAAQCASEQGQFLIYHDKLFLNQNNLDINSLKNYARQIGSLDANKFDQCLDGNKYEKEVQQDNKEALDLEVKGTPTFFINGIRIAGAAPKEALQQAIEYLLKK